MGRYTYVDDERLPLGPLLCWIKEEDLQQFVAEQAHVSVKWLKGKDSCGNIVDGVPVSVVDSILTAYNVPLWYVYPELGPDWEAPLHEIILAWCPRCLEANPDHPRFGRLGTMVVPAFDGTCLWCGEQTGGAEIPDIGANPRCRKADEEIYQEARRLYLRGYNLTDIATKLFKHTEFPTAKRLAISLSTEFARRGWPIRSRHFTSNFRHGRYIDGHRCRSKLPADLQPRCMGFKVSSHGKVTTIQCRKPSSKGSDYCFHHDPTQRERVLIEMKEVRRTSPINGEAIAA